MTNNDELAMNLKAAAEKVTVLDLDTSQIERGNDGYYECPVCCGLGEVEAETDFCNIDGVALGVQFYGIGEHHGAAEEYFRTVAPANILALLAERDADKKRIADYQHQLSRYSMSPGEADQRRCESRVVRDALGYCMDSENVAPVDLYLKIEELRQRIAELETLTKEQDKRMVSYAAIATKNASEAGTVSVPTFEEWCQMEDMKPLGWVREAMKEAYDGCRAAMLKDGPVTAATVPDGWKLTPVEPTMPQELAGCKTLTNTGKMSRLMKTRISNIYRAMLAAAPAAPEQEV